MAADSQPLASHTSEQAGGKSGSCSFSSSRPSDASLFQGPREGSRNQHTAQAVLLESFRSLHLSGLSFPPFPNNLTLSFLLKTMAENLPDLLPLACPHSAMS